MSRSTRFPVAVHILAMLAAFKDQFVSSDQIAMSVATNPVVIRRVLSLLNAADLVVTQAGAHGGAKLGVNPADVSLLDVYNAVEDQSLFRVHEPHQQCPVACCVKSDMEGLLGKLENNMERELGTIKLSKVTNRATREFRNYVKESS